MDRFLQMRVFIAVAEEESFSATARRLQMSPPAVTRAISTLEKELGIKLLNRSTRHVRATEAGQRYLDDARRILADIAAAEDAVAGINAKPRGRIAVTAPVLFGRQFIIPGIVEYLRRYPNTQVNAVFLDRVVNLLEEGIDVGVRIGALPDSGMRALRVGEVRWLLLASGEYLEQHGLPGDPEELLGRSVIASSAGSFTPGWRFRIPDGERLVKVRPRLTTTTNDAAIEAALQGLGICRALSYQAADHVAQGSLKIMLREFEPLPQPIHIVHREDRYSSTKVRAFIDLLADQLRGNDALNSTSTAA
jgi:DNA-binding transcriptional LysR family regulator